MFIIFFPILYSHINSYSYNIIINYEKGIWTRMFWLLWFFSYNPIKCFLLINRGIKKIKTYYKYTSQNKLLRLYKPSVVTNPELTYRTRGVSEAPPTIFQ